MKKVYKYIWLFLIIISLIIIIIIIANMRLIGISRNRVNMMNYSAENVSKCLASSNYTFNNYCDEYNIPKTGTIYISGVTTSYYDLIIDANEYCNRRKNITVNPTTERSIDYHWTIKIENNNISEIWTCKTQLSQTQLKSYNYNEQVDMIPLLKKDKFDYAIGYCKTSY